MVAALELGGERLAFFQRRAARRRQRRDQPLGLQTVLGKPAYGIVDDRAGRDDELPVG